MIWTGVTPHSRWSACCNGFSVTPVSVVTSVMTPILRVRARYPDWAPAHLAGFPTSFLHVYSAPSSSIAVRSICQDHM